MIRTPIIRERTIEAVLLFFLFLGAGICSCFSQEINPSDQNPSSDTKNTGTAIRYADLNHSTEAVPLNAFINGPFDELKPSLTPCGKRLYFSRSLHPLNTGGETDLEDIWYTEFEKSDNSWSQPIRLPGHLNNLGPNFINSVSMTGDTLILGNQYRKNGKMRAGLSYSVNKEGQWSPAMPIYIKNDYNISEHANAYVSLKSGIIISAVQRCDSYGDRDLYVSFWDGEKATEPLSMGGMINSELEESSPFLASDHKTLYFASKGHHGHGGYDVYVSKRLDDSWVNWSEPENLGPAVNGSMDDEFFSITYCGKFAIFSKTVSIHNSDLYKISLEELTGIKGNTEEVPLKDATSVAAVVSL
ncbi:MAG TPA: hypothetical protein VK658_01735 [Chryseolinea sp.]|nr:hypothetical protein [Chryseolinea sp.]